MTPWTIAYQAPQSMEFSRQEYWRGLPFPSPGDLPDPGIEPMSLASPALAGGFFTTSANWEVHRNDGGGGLVAKLCPTLCDAMDYSPSVSSVHGISQTGILKWVAISFSKGSS